MLLFLSQETMYSDLFTLCHVTGQVLSDGHGDGFQAQSLPSETAQRAWAAGRAQPGSDLAGKPDVRSAVEL